MIIVTMTGNANRGIDLRGSALSRATFLSLRFAIHYSFEVSHNITEPLICLASSLAIIIRL
jgi:hypothetical protein